MTMIALNWIVQRSHIFNFKFYSLTRKQYRLYKVNLSCIVVKYIENLRDRAQEQ